MYGPPATGGGPGRITYGCQAPGSLGLGLRQYGLRVIGLGAPTDGLGYPATGSNVERLL